MEATAQSRDPVKLVVKAPNQQFEDQTVDCELQWNIRRLKEHLSEVYPCKPTPAEQKLIYSGQLLKDQLILKDILRHYDDPQPQFHILHLVYTPKNQTHANFNSTKSSQKGNSDAISNDGLRHRHVAANQSQENQPQNVTNVTPNIASNISMGASSSNCPASGPPGGGGNNIPGFGFPQQPNQYLMAQQMAMQSWMQQAYIQYMNQYMSLLSEGMRPEAVFMQHQAQPQMPYMPQNVPFSQPNFGQNLPGSSLPSQSAAVATDAQAAGAGDGAANTPGVAAVAAAAAAQQPPQAQNQQPQPRFPNLVQDNPEENRDWLDVFYTMIRLMVLLTLVYFYSSALRCAVVMFIGLAIYFYHTRFFRRQVQNAREANNNNVAAAVENIQQQQQQQHNQDANAEQGNNDGPEPALAANRESGEDAEIVSSTLPEVPEANGTSVIAFVRTFVVSFFVSLLPETPAL